MRRTPSASRYTVQRGRERMLSCRCCWIIQAKPEFHSWVAIREGWNDWIDRLDPYEGLEWRETKYWRNYSAYIMECNEHGDSPLMLF